MLVRDHVVVSLSGGAIIYLLTASLPKGMLFCLTGIFIDLDHLFDYIKNYGWKIISLKEFKKIFYNCRLKRVYVLFHSYELLTILGVSLWYFKVRWGWIVFLSLSIHFLMDQIFFLIQFKKGSPWFYFLIYRLSKRFEPQWYKNKS